MPTDDERPEAGPSLGRLGPFVRVEFHERDAAPPTEWARLTVLLDGSAALAERVDQVRSALTARSKQHGGRSVEDRVAASVTHLGMVARLIAPRVALRGLGYDISTEPEDIWWQPVEGPVRLSCALLATTADETVRDVDEGMGDDPVGTAVAALTETVCDEHRLSRRIAWGNVASAANGAATTIGAAAPDLASAATRQADRLLQDPRVEGGRLRAGPRFQRRSCCLIYRIGGDRRAVCGDCVLRG